MLAISLGAYSLSKCHTRKKVEAFEVRTSKFLRREELIGAFRAYESTLSTVMLYFLPDCPVDPRVNEWNRPDAGINSVGIPSIYLQLANLDMHTPDQCASS